VAHLITMSAHHRGAARFREPAVNVDSLRILRRHAGWATVGLSTSGHALAKTLLADCLVCRAAIPCGSP
jgi:hypothetical protein